MLMGIVGLMEIELPKMDIPEKASLNGDIVVPAAKPKIR